MSRSVLPCRSKRRTFFLCWLAYTCAYVGRTDLSVAMPSLRITFVNNSADMGLVGTGFYVLYAVGQLVNGYWGDRVNGKNFIFAALLASSILNFSISFCNQMWMVAIFWSLNGFVQSMLWGPLMRILSNWYPKSRSNRIGVGMSTSMVTGYFVATVVLGQVLLVQSWRWLFLLVSCVLLLASVIWMIFARSSPEEAGFSLRKDPGLARAGKKISLRETFQVYSSSHLWPVAMASMAQGIIKEGISLWAPMLIVQAFNQPISSMLRFAALIPFFNLLGVLFTGWLNQRLRSDEKKSAVILFAIAAAASIALFVLNLSIPFLCVLLIAVASGMMYGTNTIFLSIVPFDFVEKNAVSSIAGIMDFHSYIGAGISGVVTGAIADRVGWRYVFLFWTLVGLAGMLLILGRRLFEAKRVD